MVVILCPSLYRRQHHLHNNYRHQFFRHYCSCHMSSPSSFNLKKKLCFGFSHTVQILHILLNFISAVSSASVTMKTMLMFCLGAIFVASFTADRPGETRVTIQEMKCHQDVTPGPAIDTIKIITSHWEIFFFFFFFGGGGRVGGVEFSDLHPGHFLTLLKEAGGS